MSNPEYQRVCKLAADRAKRITELEAKLSAVEHRLAEYIASGDTVAGSYASQLRRVINDAWEDEK
jgi:hypothetical protein